MPPTPHILLKHYSKENPLNTCGYCKHTCITWQWFCALGTEQIQNPTLNGISIFISIFLWC